VRWLLVAALFACSDDPIAADGGAGDGGRAGPATLRFDLTGEAGRSADFFDFPFPSDLRIADGTIDLTGYPNPRGNTTVANLLAIADEMKGWSAVSVAYFRFDAPVRASALDRVIAPGTSGPVLLVDVDPDSPDRGRLLPAIALSAPFDIYAQHHLLSVAAFPGIVLEANRTYAFVVLRSFGDADGGPLGVPAALASLAAGTDPGGAWGTRALEVYAPLFETLDSIGVARTEVAAATVFTTGDVVADLHALSTAVTDAVDVEIEGLRVDPVDGAGHERYCELTGTVSLPQYQRGTPPFSSEGLFEIAGGLPVEQRREVAPVVLAIPKREMPSSGFPLMMYFHGSGGVAAQVVDRGPRSEGGTAAPGTGPAHVIAEHGFASFGAALPLSPDRLPGASSIEYLNFANLAAFRDTFRQGVIEQRLLLDALLAMELPPAALAGCDGATLPAGATSFRFDPAHVAAIGQSMGGMYTNLIGAVDPRLEALVPTGAGGFWSDFITETMLVPGIVTLVSSMIGIAPENLSHVHPVLHLLQIAWESAEPMVFVPRLSRRPLEGLPSRPVYEPVGLGDSFFPPAIYDSMALAYRHEQAGEIVWPSMQEALAQDGRDGLATYPVSENLVSARGEPYTGVVVQYAGDGFSDPHDIFMQLEAVRYQWGCFLKSRLETGRAVVPAPATLGTPCPTR
jgi:hypothetical protein